MSRSEFESNNNNYNTVERLITAFLWLVYICWFFLFIRDGIDVTDQALYLTKYKYFFDPEVNLRSLGVFLTDFTGALIYRAVDTGQALTLSVASWFLYVLSGVAAYNTFKKYVPRTVLLCLMIIGSFFSMTWVHILNYNATSMFMQTLAICVLVKGLDGAERRNSGLLFLSGFLIGINVFNRLPNILEAVFGLAVLWEGVASKKKPVSIIKRCLYYLAGFIVGLFALGFTAVNMLGTDKITGYITNTGKTFSSNDSSHGVFVIINTLYEEAIVGIKANIEFILPVLVVSLLILALNLIFRNHESVNKVIFVTGCILAAVFAYVFVQKMENRSLVYSMAATALLSYFLFTAIAFFKKNPNISGIAFVSLLAELVLCIGTNNGWFYQIVFMILPLTAAGAILMSIENKSVFRATAVVAVAFTILFAFSGYKFARGYVYRDAPKKQLNYYVKAEEYKYLMTSDSRKECLDMLDADLKDIKDKYAITFGDFLIPYVIGEIKPFTPVTWIDLDSYNIDRLLYDMDESIKAKGLPLIIIAETSDKPDAQRIEKLKYLHELINENEYYILKSNDYYTIYSVTNS